MDMALMGMGFCLFAFRARFMYTMIRYVVSCLKPREKEGKARAG